MKNQEVIESYFNFMSAHSHNDNLYTRHYGDEWQLVNYSTPLVTYKNDTYYINTKKYSVTTSKIQTYINRYINDHFTTEKVEQMQI